MPINSKITGAPFRFWCQKILPAVYDDSLSYYELLCKVVDYLNKVMEDDINVVNLVNELEEYINNYFSNLDVQEEINNKLDAMAEDGTLYAIIERFTQPIIDDMNNDIEEFKDETNTTVNNFTASITERFDTVSNYVNENVDVMSDTVEYQNERIEVLEGRMNSFSRLPDGSLSTAADAELADIRVAYDGYTWTTAGDSVRGQINEIHNSILTNGLNLFDKRVYTANTYINSSGEEVSRSGIGTSDYIEIDPTLEYLVTRGMGSATVATISFYDENKTYISGLFPSVVSVLRCTPPTNAKYARISFAQTYIDAITFSVDHQSAGEHYLTNYGKVLSGLVANKPVLIGTSGVILYDRINGTLSCSNPAGNIIVYYQNQFIQLGTSVTIGTDSILYFNTKTLTLFTSNDFYAENKDVIFIKSLKMPADIYYPAITVSSSPNTFAIDKINHTITVNPSKKFIVKDVYSSAYSVILDNAQSFTYTPSENAFVFDLTTRTYGVKTISAINERDVPLILIVNNEITSIVEYETLVNDDYLNDKTAVCYGDSLTWYDGNAFTWGPHQGETCIGFESYLREYGNMSVTNRGASGQTTIQICSRIRTASDLGDFDYMTIMGGDNDSRLETNIGTLLPAKSEFNTNTVYGALQSAIEYALNANPELRIVLMTQPIGFTYISDSQRLERVDEDYVNAYRRVAELYGIPLIDLWKESGINELTRNTYYADPADATNQLYMYHPNNDGWKRISRIIVKALESI